MLFRSGRNRIIASATGRFGRVHDTGDCLNLRSAPTTDSRIIGCVFDNTLLEIHDDTAPYAGWRYVYSAQFDSSGYVNSAYLEE